MQGQADFAFCTDAAAVNVSVLICNGLNQLVFINCYSVVMVAVNINSYVIIASTYGSNGIVIVCLNSFDELVFVKSYGIVVATVIINIYVIIASTYGSNGIS